MNSTGQDGSTITMRPIGRVHSPFKSTVGMPIQTVAAAEHCGHIEIFESFAAGLRDVQEFQYLIVLTHLHEAVEKLEVTPFMDTASHGVFATRAPARPNRIDLSIIELLRLDGGKLEFRGDDMLDGTPVLDIKPYIPRLDARSTERIGWFAEGLMQLPGKLSDDRMR